MTKRWVFAMHMLHISMCDGRGLLVSMHMCVRMLDRDYYIGWVFMINGIYGIDFRHFQDDIFVCG